MKTNEEILDEINDNEDWYRDKKTNKIIRKFISLDRILEDSSILVPAINIRQLNPKKVNDIKDDIIANKGTVTPAMAMIYAKNAEGKNIYCIMDGNHKQTAVRDLCKEFTSEKCKMFGFNELEIQVLKGNPKKKEPAWIAFCISYRLNRDATTVEKILAIGYGWEHYGKKRNLYNKRLVKEFGETSQHITRHKQAYEKLNKLSPESHDIFMDEYKYKRIDIAEVITALDLLLENDEKDNEDKKSSIIEPKRSGDPIIGSIVNDAKKGDEILNSVVNDISVQFTQNVEIDKLRESVREATIQIQNDDEMHDINILNNRYYSPMKGGLKTLLESKDLPEKLIENIKGYHKDVHNLMRAAKNKQKSP